MAGTKSLGAGSAVSGFPSIEPCISLQHDRRARVRTYARPCIPTRQGKEATLSSPDAPLPSLPPPPILPLPLN